MRVPVSIWKWSSEPPPGPTRQQKLRKPNAVQGCRGFTPFHAHPHWAFFEKLSGRLPGWDARPGVWCAAAASASCWPRNPCREGEKSCYYVVCTYGTGHQSLEYAAITLHTVPAVLWGLFAFPPARLFLPLEVNRPSAFPRCRLPGGLTSVLMRNWLLAMGHGFAVTFIQRRVYVAYPQSTSQFGTITCESGTPTKPMRAMMR
ncbi:hypothetical protein EDB80DRAFT_385905 [Ilyonectria destructans]|nr:hypothetical protein EDB80DRAFT_385905 [Ilyonectria destructans]